MILTENELALYLKVSKVFLYKCRKKGMPFIRISCKCIRYDLNDVLVWLKENRSLSGNDIKHAGGEKI